MKIYAHEGFIESACVRISQAQNAVPAKIVLILADANLAKVDILETLTNFTAWRANTAARLSIAG